MARGLDPSSVRVGDIMSSPIIYVGPDARVEEVREVMIRHRVRRVPVMSGGRVLGMITVSDIAMVYPEMLRLREPLAPGEGEPMSGICERCGNYSEDLMLVEGSYLCGRCRSELI